MTWCTTTPCRSGADKPSKVMENNTVITHGKASSFDEWNSLVSPAIGTRTLLLKPSSKSSDKVE
jgi:hypothetical protein